jgi:hypothetical protein
MNIVTIAGIDTSMPSGWDELSKRNLLFLAERFPFTPSRGFLWEFFIHCLHLPARPRLAWRFFRNFHCSRKINRIGGDLLRRYAQNAESFDEEVLPDTDLFAEQIWMAIEALDRFNWLFESFYIEKCILPEIRHGFQTWYGPDWLLSNVTGEEFDKADLFFLRFLRDHQPEDLRRLLACVWRPKAARPSLDDVREPFSEFRIEHHAALIARWPERLQIAAFLCYTGMRNAFIELDDARIIFRKQWKSNSVQAKESVQWAKILLRLADNGSLGSHREVKQAYIHDIISKLAQLKQDSDHVPQ